MKHRLASKESNIKPARRKLYPHPPYPPFDIKKLLENNIYLM